METYAEPQLEAILAATPEGWARLAVLTLLGTGMRVGELCALTMDDVEDEGDAAFTQDSAWQGRKIPQGAGQPSAAAGAVALPESSPA